MNIEKRGFTMGFSFEEYVASLTTRKGHYEPAPPMTDKERAARKRAQAALKELSRSAWVEWPYMEDEIRIRKHPTRVWVFDETYEEWLERWKKEQSS